MKAKLRTASVLANMALLLLSVLVVEGTLQLSSAFLFDLDSLRRPLDSRGFHNPSALSAATVVALGDSQTYGSGVHLEEAWPSVLAAGLGADVYNMAMPGYGPMRNLTNLPLALELRPQLVIFALYFGNDFYEDFRFALENKQLSHYTSPDQLAEITNLENASSIAHEVRHLFRRDDADSPWQALTWLARHSEVYSLLQAWKRYLLSNSASDGLLSRSFHKAKAAITDEQSSFVSVYEDRDWRTIFTAPYRWRVLNESDPRIRAGVAISRHMIELMHARSKAAGVGYLVLLVPTKEYVFWSRVKHSDEHRMLVELVRSEEKIRREISQYLEDRGIKFIDLTGVLRGAEQQPYFEDGDGHPNALGHRLIAESVLAFMKGQRERAPDLAPLSVDYVPGSESGRNPAPG